MGRPAHSPTDEQRQQVREWVRDGMAQEHIAAALKIAPKTLREHYRDDLDASDEEWKQQFRASLKRDVLRADCAPALRIFLAKVLLGYRETVAIDPTKEAPSEDLTDEQLRARIAERARGLREGPAIVGRPRAARAA